LQEGSVAAVKADMVIADVSIKLNTSYTLRTELQHLSTKNDNKNWAAALIELNTSKGLSFFASDLIDYQTNKINYYNIGAAFNKNAFRILLNVSRQRAGLICIGGLCRYSPSFTGVNASISYNF
jgi:endo-1,4-beta-D-glucanase Y